MKVFKTKLTNVSGIEIQIVFYFHPHLSLTL